MAKRKPKKPPRPKLRKWFPQRGPTWLKLEPAGLATVGGLFFATCSMLVYLARQLFGSDIELPDIVVGVVLTFVVSYAGTGIFVWYMLHLAEGELGRPKPPAGAQEEPEFETAAVPESMPDEEQIPAETEEPS